MSANVNAPHHGRARPPPGPSGGWNMAATASTPGRVAGEQVFEIDLDGRALEQLMATPPW
jgi:hypothetical protein